MSLIEENKSVVRKIYEQALNRRNLVLLQDVIAREYVGIGSGTGVAAFEAAVTAVIRALPDAQWHIEELIGEGNKVYVRWKFQGTHNGPFQTLAATGRAVVNDGMAVYELKDGKVIAATVYTDRLSFLQQLQVLPDVSVLYQKASPGALRFIDKFVVPVAAKSEFLERVRINRDFIKTLPGFIEDAAYGRTDEQGNLVLVTIAVWADADALKNAKEAMQAEYKKQGFDPVAMLARLGITMDRGIYTSAGDLEPG